MTIVSKIGRSGSFSMNRRDFIKSASVASALTLTGCADSPKQEILPHVKGAPDQIPGVAVWYRSTCTECSAGCGIEVRTREGRAVKIEGSRKSPVNKGGLCAIGQSSLQDLYDPDRVRQPLKKENVNGKDIFKPIDWIEAYETVAKALSQNSEKAFITGVVNGALLELIDDFCKPYKVDHISYEPLCYTTEAKANELVYGVNGVPKYDFSKAEIVVNFGADFLETWVSPCEYARGWASSRKSKAPLRVFHIEPRLSLTGANADSWFKCAPGTEILVALALLKEILARGFNGGDIASKAKSLCQDIDLDNVAQKSGVKTSAIVSMASFLASAKGSLVLSGGSGASTYDSISLHKVTAIINVLLGNVGKTIEPALSRQFNSRPDKISDLITKMNSGSIKLLLVDRSNPAFTLPKGSGFEFAVKNVKMVVSFSNKLDETSRLADIIMPTSTSLESWGDVRPYKGVYSLIQPAMTPVFNTKALGDILIDFANGMNRSDVVGGVKSYLQYVQNSWKKIHSEYGIQKSFDLFWKESLENGGFFPEVKSISVANPSEKSFEKINLKSYANLDSAGTEGETLVIYPFSSIKTFDGRSANRPWLQETPDPLSQIVWDCWAEIHPNTAGKHKLAHGDVVTLRNKYGELNVPVFVTEHVHENIVALPLGQGHETFGRYAETVKQANVFNLLSPQPNSTNSSFALLSAKVSVARSRLNTHLVNMDGSKSQLNRELAVTKYINSPADLAKHHHHHDHHHEPKQMYTQREHPLYKWGMSVDLSACTGCSACVVACYAENNIHTVGKELVRQGREMAWLRIDRYFEKGPDEELVVNFMPVMCQHCNNAPCEPVCPVYATYHNEEGLNSMVYNRCVGTRYCANNCSYKVRRFNWFEYEVPEPLTWQFNPDVVTRSVGVMEKCTFCIQRITEGKDHAKDEGRLVLDGEVQPACVQSCPTEALVFGNLNDPKSKVSKLSKSDRSYKVLDHHLNTQPSVSYLKDIKYRKI